MNTPLQINLSSTWLKEQYGIIGTYQDRNKLYVWINKIGYKIYIIEDKKKASSGWV